MSKHIEAIRKIRKETTEHIRAIMEKHHLDTLYASDIDEGSSPILVEDPNDGNYTYTLTSIILEEGKLTFEGSNCCDDISLTENQMDIELLSALADWLDENEDQIEDADTDDNE